MPFNVFLVTQTPYVLRYLLIQSGTSTSDEQYVLQNNLGPTPDLRTDTLPFHDFPMNNLVKTPITLTDQAAARRLLLSDGLATLPDIERIRSHCYLTPRNSQDAAFATPQWSVDANEGSNIGPKSNGFGVLLITGPGAATSACYLTIRFQHTYDR